MKLELNDVSFLSNGKLILNQVSFHLTDNEFVSVLADDDESLYALTAAILGTIKLTSGSIIVDERDITALKPYERHISLISLSHMLKENLTVYDNIILPLRDEKMNEEAAEKLTDEVIDAFHLSTVKAQVPAVISNYQRLIVATARAFVTRPKILLLYDPLRDIDKERHDEYIKTVKEAMSHLDHPIVLYLGGAPSFINRVIAIEHGIINENARFDVIKEYPHSPFLANMLSLQYDQEKAKLNPLDILLPVSFENGFIIYDLKHLTLNEIEKMRLQSTGSPCYMKLDPSFFSFSDYGGYLSFSIKDVFKVSSSLVLIDFGSFKLVRKESTSYELGKLLYYPREKMVLLDKDLNRLNSLYPLHDNLLSCRIVNAFTKTILIGNALIKVPFSINRSLTQILINKNTIFSLGSSPRDSLVLSRVVTIEEFKDYYLIGGYSTSAKDQLTIRLSKKENPLLKDHLYLKLNGDDLSLPPYSL